jgi:glycosyltransferase involved in cell wall biosynthesis
MRIAILANDKNSFVKPLAEGMQRMATALGARPKIFYDGLAMLSLPLGMNWSSPRAAAGQAMRMRRHKKLFDEFVEKIREFDLVVVVAHLPSSLTRGSFQNIELLRRFMPECPIVNYDLVYLPTVAKWSGAMLRGEETGLSDADKRSMQPGSFGMGRYDWYLVASPLSEIPMPETPQPCSMIGINLDDGSLYPDQGGEFRVLVDFEQTRSDYLSFREVQLEALRMSGVSYDVLDKPMTRDEIRAVYRKTGAFLMAHRESFGLPICELQACGSLIFTPRAEWAGAHWIKTDLKTPGPGRHSRNFVVYENDAESLARRLEQARAGFDAAGVRNEFLAAQPQLYYGDQKALGDFLTMVDEGRIDSRAHQLHGMIGR